LRKHALNGFFQRGFCIVADGDDAEEGFIHGLE
jgi:hypothetical protein